MKLLTVEDHGFQYLIGCDDCPPGHVSVKADNPARLADVIDNHSAETAPHPHRMRVSVVAESMS
jgi:hypothetical protein